MQRYKSDHRNTLLQSQGKIDENGNSLKKADSQLKSKKSSKSSKKKKGPRKTSIASSTSTAKIIREWEGDEEATWYKKKK